MLNQVSESIATMTRNVMINHPNCFNCRLYKQYVTRKSSGTFGGEPLLGSMGILDTDDEVEYEYRYAGDGYALPAEAFSAAPMMDRNDANIGPSTEFRFLITPAAQSGDEHFFTVSTHDVVYLLLGGEDDDPQIAFEVVGRETITNIPPFNVRYICNRRDDLHIKKGGEFLTP